MSLPPLGPLCIVVPLFICTVVIFRGYKKLEVNWVINIAEAEVFHCRSQKKKKKIGCCSTLTQGVNAPSSYITTSNRFSPLLVWDLHHHLNVSMFTYQISGSRIRGSDPDPNIRIRIRKIVPAVLISVPALISVPCAPKNHRKNKRPAPLIRVLRVSHIDQRILIFSHKG